MQPDPDDIINPLSIDCVILSFEAPDLRLLLIQRNQEPKSGFWALPGGFIRYEEDIDAASKRILGELTGVSDLFMDQLGAFGAVDRYPLRRVVTLAYYAMIRPGKHQLQPGPEADAVAWHSTRNLPELPFDHQSIVDAALQRLQQQVRHRPIGFNLLPESFTLLQLQQLYEAILDRPFDKSNFRRKLRRMDLLVPLDRYEDGVAHRAARLHRFDPGRYEALCEKGFVFDL
ncbi:MAG: NUDIX domain-containing protein [Bacteroidota bacterium]